jgi:hypothetical protein
MQILAILTLSAFGGIVIAITPRRNRNIVRTLCIAAVFAAGWYWEDLCNLMTR